MDVNEHQVFICYRIFSGEWADPAKAVVLCLIKNDREMVEDFLILLRKIIDKERVEIFPVPVTPEHDGLQTGDAVFFGLNANVKAKVV